MKLTTYLKEGNEQLALMVDELLFDMDSLHPDLPMSMIMFLNYWDDCYPLALAALQAMKEGRMSRPRGILVRDVEWLAPVPLPNSCRNGMGTGMSRISTRQDTSSKIPGHEKFPEFPFTDHHAIKGPGEIICMPDHLEQLDFTMQTAIVICRQGRNIRASQADAFIGGLMVMNGLISHGPLRENMKGAGGTTKGNSIATSIGPCLITLDELSKYEIPARIGHEGVSWNLPISCEVNGKLAGEGNLGEMDWTFAEIIERISYGAQLFPGDVIGSGDLRNIQMNADPNHQVWLKPGDKLNVQVEGLGILQNTIVLEDSDYSLSSKTKQTD